MAKKKAKLKSKTSAASEKTTRQVVVKVKTGAVIKKKTAATKKKNSGKPVKKTFSKPSNQKTGAGPKKKITKKQSKAATRTVAGPTKTNSKVKNRTGAVPDSAIKQIVHERSLNEDQEGTLRSALSVGINNVFLKASVGSKRELGKACVDLQELLTDDGAKEAIKKHWLKARKISYEDAYRRYFKTAIRIYKKGPWLPDDLWVDTALELISHDEYLTKIDPSKKGDFRKEIVENKKFQGTPIGHSKTMRKVLREERNKDADQDTELAAEKRHKHWIRLGDRVAKFLTEFEGLFQDAVAPSQKVADAGTKDMTLSVDIKSAMDPCEKLQDACEEVIKKSQKLATKLQLNKKDKK
jgi:hypothetical protein